MRRSLLTWLMGGALTASAVLNGWLMSGERARSPGAPVPPPCPLTDVELELTPEQRERIKGCCAPMTDARSGLSRELQDACARLCELLTARDLKEAAALEAVEEVGRLQLEILKSRVRAVCQVRASLTPQQLRLLCGDSCCR